MSESRRVVVTGLGAVTPIGNDAPSTWRSVLEGRSGIAPITLFDASEWPNTIVGEVKNWDPTGLLPARDLRHMDRSVQFAAVSALEALRDAGIDYSKPLGPEVGVIFGAGAGGYSILDEQWKIMHTKGARRVSPFFLTNVLPDAASGYIAMLTGANGPNMAVISACATGAGAIGEASEIIKRGDAEVMIAGGTEAPLTPFLFSAFAALRAIASPGDDPASACKPFDIRRDGFVVAEGAGAVLLESAEHAEARGATPYCEL
ncbi:MAG TPA: beta-ketoacyl synthase N-terminal-like domain-containing protein, partial [Dehalococcoidia bacterium]|nr:beta-ketoacyl synthase N-terminal-like domain-containing protein [Dehalococcoidia bacterium]